MDNIFEKISSDRGMVARIYSDFSSFEGSVKAHYAMNRALLLEESLPLPRSERELLAYVTSETNGDEYCRNHHKEAFDNHSSQLDKNSSGRADFLTRLARTLTATPKLASAFHNEFLSFGFTESECQHAVNIVSYFNYTNRLAFAMDIQLEEGFEASCR